MSVAGSQLRIVHKNPCRLATTANHGLSGLAAIDGVTPVAGDRILVRANTSTPENGIYDAASGAWARSRDMDEDGPGSDEITAGLTTYIQEGDTLAKKSYVLTTTGTITIGGTGLTFEQAFTAGSPAGDVSGPGSSTDTAIAKWSGAGGDTLADSTILIDGSGNIVPSVTDSNALGTTLLQWSDLFLASGGVINFSNGDVSITHANNILTFAGASTGFRFAGPTVPGANNFYSLGINGLAWSDLFLGSGSVVNFNSGDATITHSTNTLTFGGATSGYFYDNPWKMLERASAIVDTAAYGQFWVRNDVPNTPMFTDDAGTDYVLNEGGIGGSSGTVDNALIRANGTGGSTIQGGASSNSVILDDTGSLIPELDDGGALGNTTFKWGDLFLASGGVVDFNSGDVTITHSSNKLDFAGATAGYDFDNPLFLVERAAALADVAAHGQFWVRNDVPNTPMFTDDAGTDYVLNEGGTVSGAGTDNKVMRWDGTTDAQDAAVTVDDHSGAGTGHMYPDGDDEQDLGQSGNRWRDLYLGSTIDSSSALVLAFSGTTKITFPTGGGEIWEEQASAPTTAAAQGAVWVRNDAPNTLMFTDDAGTDFEVIGSGVSTTLTDQQRVIYVNGANGSDSNDGLNIEAATETIGSALTKAAVLTPTVTDPVVVKVLGGGDYVEDIAIGANIKLIAQGVRLDGRVTSMVDNTSIDIWKIDNVNGGNTVAVTTNGNNVKIKADIIESGTGAAASGIDFLSTSGEVVELDVGLIDCTTNLGADCVNVGGSGTLVGRVGVMEVQGTTANRAINIVAAATVGLVSDRIDASGTSYAISMGTSGSFLDITVGYINSTNAYTIASGCTLSMFVARLTGSEASGGTANVTKAGVVDLVLTDQQRVVYVNGTNGDGSASSTIEGATLTIQQAITAANALTPTAASPVTIKVLGGGSYTEDITVGTYTHIIAQGVRLIGQIAAMGDGSSVEFAEVDDSGGGVGSPGILASGAGIKIKVGIIKGATTFSDGIQYTGTGDCELDVDLIDHTGGNGRHGLAVTSTGTVSGRIGTIKVGVSGGNDCISISGASTGQLSVGALIASGSGRQGIDINASGATWAISVGILTTTAGTSHTVASGSTLYLFAGHIVGIGSISGSEFLSKAGHISQFVDPTRITSTSTSYAVLPTDRVIDVDRVGGSLTITLPAATASGRVIKIKRNNGDAGAGLTVDANGAETIDGAANRALAVGDFIEFVDTFSGQWISG